DRARTVLASAGGSFLVTFDGGAVQMVLPVLRRELHTSAGSVQWAMTAYLLVPPAAYLPTGRLGDIYGRSRIWFVGLAAFLVGSLACVAAPDLGWLGGARAPHALGGPAPPPHSA